MANKPRAEYIPLAMLQHLVFHKWITNSEMEYLESLWSSRLTSQAGQGWKIEFRNGSIYIGSPEILRGFYTHSIHGERKWEARYFQWYKKEWGDEDYRDSFNTEEEAQKWLMENVLQELNSLLTSHAQTERDAVLDAFERRITAQVSSVYGKESNEATRDMFTTLGQIKDILNDFRTKPPMPTQESEGTK